LAEAEGLYAKARSASPDDFDVLHLSGLLAHQQGRSSDAVSLLGRALELNPGSTACELRLGLALLARGDAAEAEKRLRAALRRDPSVADGWEGLALCLKLQDRLEEAVDCHGRVVAIRPSDATGWCNLGLTLSSLGRIGEAIGCHERALSADPHSVAARFGRAQALHQGLRVAEAVTEFERVIAKAPERVEARSYRLVALHYLDGVSRERMYAEHAAFGRSLGDAPAAPGFVNSREPDRRLRLGILSPDLRSHSCAYFIEPIIRHLDRSQFELLLYFDHFREDAVSKRLRGQADAWRHTVGMSNADVERAVRADQPDIMIDLAGHLALTSRLPLFARRLAPVQVTYLGYPDTTGVPAMDYRFTDAVADPAPDADRFASERLVRFGPTAWSYQPPADAPEPRRESDGAGTVTFGCLNYIGKITDSLLCLWAGLLGSVPLSRLVLKGSGFADPAFCARYRERLRACGIDPARADLLDYAPTVAAHLSTYNRIDIALDSMPYNGTTTTCEALWMGVPVVTALGDRHASRVGASLLGAVGHPEWVARDRDDFVRVAAGLASDPGLLAAVRGSLRAEMARSPLLDHAGQAVRFGGALRQCWRSYCSAGVAGAWRPAGVF
jgi:predicted O-linked N-acetylglucosamine transferase (SPINDLY family)